MLSLQGQPLLGVHGGTRPTDDGVHCVAAKETQLTVGELERVVAR